VTDRPEARAYGITLLDAGTGRHYEARGVRIRIGRGPECEVQPVDAPESVVSRIHAELTVGPSGGLAVRDAGSRHGTFLNDEPVTTAVRVRLGDRITLGPGGPVLIVEGLGTAPKMPVVRRPGAPGQRTVMSLIAGVSRLIRKLWAAPPGRG
jgi:pSer/pThr/pTyr-binding forkhead associated (FHA) protein